MGNEPRSKLDIIYQEVLGEVVQVMKRLETVSAQLDGVLAAKPGERAAEVIQLAALTASGKLRTDLDRAIGNACKSLSGAVSEATATLHALETERQRVSVEWAAVTFSAAVMGGLLGGLVVQVLR